VKRERLAKRPLVECAQRLLPVSILVLRNALVLAIQFHLPGRDQPTILTAETVRTS